MNRKKISLILFLAAFLASFLSGCRSKPKTPVVVFAAGSLIFPFSELEKAYEAKHADIDLQMEYHGSIQVIRHSTELHEPIDVIATADANLIPLLMYQTKDPDSGLPYASWFIRFATNRMAIAYSSTSKYADEIAADNWYDIITRSDVKVGIADPRFDAVGYRTLMLASLAENYYSQRDIFDTFISKQFSYPITQNKADTPIVIHVPEILETKDNSNLILRGASIQLIALLESGDLDYSFEYESVIKQHQLSMISLPEELNLGNDKMQDFYEQVEVREDFKRFKSVDPVFIGDQIGYGITIPSNAPHYIEAADFIAFLLSPEGQQIMADNYHPMLSPVQVDNFELLPTVLKNITQQ